MPGEEAGGDGSAAPRRSWRRSEDRRRRKRRRRRGQMWSRSRGAGRAEKVKGGGRGRGGARPRLRGGTGWLRVPEAKPPAVVASPSASSSSSAPHRGVAITDYAPPKSNVPEAVAPYARALHEERGASGAMADYDMEVATRLDPTLAAAQVRAALNGSTVTLRRAHLAAAEQLRGGLDERDQMLLKVAEASLAEPRNAEEVIGRLRALVGRFPDDAESSFQLGSALMIPPAGSRRAGPSCYEHSNSTRSSRTHCSCSRKAMTFPTRTKPCSSRRGASRSRRLPHRVSGNERASTWIVANARSLRRTRER